MYQPPMRPSNSGIWMLPSSRSSMSGWSRARRGSSGQRTDGESSVSPVSVVVSDAVVVEDCAVPVSSVVQASVVLPAVPVDVSVSVVPPESSPQAATTGVHRRTANARAPAGEMERRRFVIPHHVTGAGDNGSPLRPIDEVRDAALHRARLRANARRDMCVRTHPNRWTRVTHGGSATRSAT